MTVILQVTGSMTLLKMLPWWAYSIIIINIMRFILRGLRVVQEGRGYDFSVMSNIGNLLLWPLWTVGIIIIQSPTFKMAGWMEYTFSWWVPAITFAGGFLGHKIIGGRSKLWGDTWNDWFILPMNIWFLVSLLPVVLTFTYENAGWQTLIFCIIIILSVFITLFDIDKKEERLDQREFIRRNKPSWRLKK